jgi:putative transposase
VAIGAPHHITQRGNARQDVFTSDPIRRAYLRLLELHAAANRLRILAYCLMTNHVHLVAIPETDTSMANTLRHAHGRFSQYWNTERNRIGHLWQNRYYSCPVDESVVGRVIAYVEHNPARAGLVESAEDFKWSSARAHAGLEDFPGWLDREWWHPRWSPAEWLVILKDRIEVPGELRAIRRATFSGRPFGSKQFIAELEKKLGRKLEFHARGQSKPEPRANDQLAFWTTE